GVTPGGVAPEACHRRGSRDAGGVQPQPELPGHRRRQAVAERRQRDAPGERLDPLAREKKRQPLELRHGARDRLAEAPCRPGGADRYHGWLRMANPLDVVIGAAEVALWLLLLGAAAHLARSGMWAWRRRVEAPPRMADGAHPRVTVLLPIRNERYVVERTLRAACALSWPRAELEIRVLDDSDGGAAT